MMEVKGTVTSRPVHSFKHSISGGLEGITSNVAQASTLNKGWTDLDLVVGGPPHNKYFTITQEWICC